MLNFQQIFQQGVLVEGRGWPSNSILRSHFNLFSVISNGSTNLRHRFVAARQSEAILIDCSIFTDFAAGESFWRLIWLRSKVMAEPLFYRRLSTALNPDRPSSSLVFWGASTSLVILRPSPARFSQTPSTAFVRNICYFIHSVISRKSVCIECLIRASCGDLERCPLQSTVRLRRMHTYLPLLRGLEKWHLKPF